MADIYEEIILLCLIHRRRQRRHKKQFWVRPIFQRRREQGEFYNLVQELRLSDREFHFKYMRMSKERFDELLAQVL